LQSLFRLLKMETGELDIFNNNRRYPALNHVVKPAVGRLVVQFNFDGQECSTDMARNEISVASGKWFELVTVPRALCPPISFSCARGLVGSWVFGPLDLVAHLLLAAAFLVPEP
jgi:hypothetical protein